MANTFTLGLTYRPRLSGFGWWDQFDAIATAEELAHIADIGCTSIRLCLSWEAFQPSSRRIGGRAMRVLEATLDAALQANLQVVATLFPLADGGILAIPDWANGSSLIDELTEQRGAQPTLTIPQAQGLPIFSEGRYRPNRTRDLFAYQPILRAQRYLISEVVGYFGSHQSLWGWQLGAGIERAHPPQSAEVAARWYQLMADAIREQCPNAQILGETTMHAMARQTSPRPEDLLTACTQLGVAAYPAEPPALARRHTSFAAFAHALATGLTNRPVTVTALGMPTTSQHGGRWAEEHVFGRPQTIFYGDTEQQAAYYETALQRLYQAGAAGIWLASYSDYAQANAHTPPFDWAPRERSLGIIDAQGNEKPAAGVIRAFATELRRQQWKCASATRQLIDTERHWHNPQASIADLWAGFEPE
jgi:endo-1,4-beta-mannosidase